jgi:hypothetical protein
VATEALVESTADTTRAKSLQHSLNPYSIQSALATDLIVNVQKLRAINMNYTPAMDPAFLRINGYDAWITLTITELLLNHTDDDRFRLLATVSGRMVDLGDHTLIWNHTETIVNSKTYSIGELESESGTPLVEAVADACRQIAYKLALDIVHPRQ